MFQEDLVVLGTLVVGAWCSYRLAYWAATDERLSSQTALVNSQQAQLAKLSRTIDHQRTTIELLTAQNSALNKPECQTVPVDRSTSPTSIRVPW